MQNDTQTRYFINALRFIREEVRTYGHGSLLSGSLSRTGQFETADVRLQGVRRTQ